MVAPVEGHDARETGLPYGPPFLIGDAGAAGRGLTEVRRALAHAGVVAEAAVARPDHRARELAAEALDAGHRFLVAVGSDRVAHALVGALVGPDGPLVDGAVLGLVGLGRQDLAATFGLPEDPAGAATHLLGANRFRVDVGRARWRGPDGGERVAVFANCAELGYPAALSVRAQRRARAGRLGRLSAALGALATTRSTPARLAVDHTAVDLRLAGVTVANGQFSMGRMKVAPRALPDDGRMSVIAFEGEPLAVYAGSRALYYGEHVTEKWVREYQSRRVEVSSARPLPVALDGCPVAGGPPLAVDVLTEALWVKV